MFLYFHYFNITVVVSRGSDFLQSFSNWTSFCLWLSWHLPYAADTLLTPAVCGTSLPCQWCYCTESQYYDHSFFLLHLWKLRSPKHYFHSQRYIPNQHAWMPLLYMFYFLVGCRVPAWRRCYRTLGCPLLSWPPLIYSSEWTRAVEIGLVMRQMSTW